MIKVGIIGGSGYTAGELIRLLIHHSKVNIDFVYSTTNAGKPISSVHQDLLGDSNLVFTDAINPNVNLVFLCLGHAKSKAFLCDNQFDKNTKIIDLGIINIKSIVEKTFHVKFNFYKIRNDLNICISMKLEIETAEL